MPRGSPRDPAPERFCRRTLRDFQPAGLTGRAFRSPLLPSRTAKPHDLLAPDGPRGRYNRYPGARLMPVNDRWHNRR